LVQDDVVARRKVAVGVLGYKSVRIRRVAETVGTVAKELFFPSGPQVYQLMKLKMMDHRQMEFESWTLCTAWCRRLDQAWGSNRPEVESSKPNGGHRIACNVEPEVMERFEQRGCTGVSVMAERERKHT
jgi:hypothetical protein